MIWQATANELMRGAIGQVTALRDFLSLDLWQPFVLGTSVGSTRSNI